MYTIIFVSPSLLLGMSNAIKSILKTCKLKILVQIRASYKLLTKYV